MTERTHISTTGLDPKAWTGLLAVGFLGLLSACGSGQQDAEALKAAAKPATFRIAAQEFPQAPAVPIADCVVENASEAELVILAQAQLQGIRGVDANLVRTIVTRPETQACLQAAGVRSGSF